MKILVISYWIKKHTNRNHLAMLDALNEHCECFVYGRKELESYSLKEKIEELVTIHSPDVLIVYSGLYLMDQPNYFRDINCLKIMMEVDYHNQKDKKSWYKDNKFDYMFWRNGDDTTSVEIPGVWWPYGTDENSFYDASLSRENIIGFAGSSKHSFYTIRQKAIEKLKADELLNMKGKSIAQTEYDRSENPNSIDWKGENGLYQNFIRSVKGFLASAEARGPFAKTFESMASKTTLLCSPILNKDLFFGSEDCYVEYKPDCSNIVERARFILNNDMTELNERAYKQFLEKHTKSKRVKELYDNIKLILEGKEPLRRWGL